MPYRIVKRQSHGPEIAYRVVESQATAFAMTFGKTLIVRSKRNAEAFAAAYEKMKGGANLPITIEETNEEPSSMEVVIDTASRWKITFTQDNAPEGENEDTAMNKLYLYAIVETFKSSNGTTPAPVMLQDPRYAFASDAETLKRRVMMQDVCGLATKPTDVDNVHVVIISETAIG